MKRKVLKLSIITIILFMIISLIYSNVGIDFNYYNINYDLENEFKICHISDYHNNKLDHNLINKIKEEKPNIIAITGDLIDSGNTSDGLIFIKEIKDIAPVFYVTGNHEADDIEVFNEFKLEIEKLGINLLENEVFIYNNHGENIKIIGLSDPVFSSSTKVLDDQKDDNAFKLLLSHRPERFDLYVKHNIDLALTGHAHGGLFKLPFVGGLIAPNQGFFPKYYEGIYQQNKTNMIVSKGVGNSIIPFRFLNRPEVIFITLR